MRIQKPSFRIIERSDSFLENMSAVQKALGSHRVNFEEGKLVLAEEVMCLLEHDVVVFEMEFFLYSYLRECVDSYLYNEDLDISKIKYFQKELNFTDIKVRGKRRCIISGTFRAWWTLFEIINKADDFCHNLKDLVVWFYEHSCGIINYVGCVEGYASRKGFSVITNFKELSGYERVVHEYITVEFDIDKSGKDVLIGSGFNALSKSSFCGYKDELVFIEESMLNNGLLSDYYNYIEKSYLILVDKVGIDRAGHVLPCTVMDKVVATASLVDWNALCSLYAVGKGKRGIPMSDIISGLTEELNKRYENMYLY